MANQDPNWSNIADNEVITYNDLQKLIDAGGIVPVDKSINLNTLYGNRCVPFVSSMLDAYVYYKVPAGRQVYYKDLVTKGDIAPKFPTYQIDFCHRDYFGWQGLLEEDKANKNYYNDDNYVYNVGDDIAIAAIIYNSGEAPSSADTFIRFNIPTGMVTSASNLSGVRISQAEIVVIEETSTYIDIKVTKSIPNGNGLGYAVCLVLYHQYPLSLGANPYTVQFSFSASSKYVTNSPISLTRNTKWAYPVFDVQLTTNYGVNTYIPYNTNFYYIADVKSTNVAHTHQFTFRFDYSPYVSFIGTSELPSDWNVSHDATNKVIFVTSVSTNEMYPPNYYRIAFLFKTIDCNKDLYATGRAYSENSLSIVSKQIYNKSDFDPSQTLAYMGYDYCDSVACKSYKVTKDTNACSATYNNFILVNYANQNDKVNVGTNAPLNTGACSVAPNYFELVGTRCKFGSPCETLLVRKNTNNCFTGNQWQTSDGQTWATNPSTGDCDFSTPNYTTYVGVYCPAGQCSTYDVYRASNTCFTGNQFYSPYNGGTTFPAQPTNVSCSANPTYDVYLGQTCFTGDCSPKNVYMNSQPCFFGNQYYIPETTLTYAVNPMQTGAPCRTTPDIQYVNYSTCYNCATYSVFRDLNPCSATYNHYFVNGNDVGTTPPSSAACNSSPIYTSQGYQTCVGCNYYNVFRDTNPCSSTYNNYFYNSGGSYINVGTSAPSGAACTCDCYNVLLTDNVEGSYLSYYSYYTCEGQLIEGYSQYGESFYACYNATLPNNFGSMTVDFQGYC